MAFSRFNTGSLYRDPRLVSNTVLGGSSGQAQSFALAEASRLANEQQNEVDAQTAARELQARTEAAARDAETRAFAAAERGRQDQLFAQQQQQFTAQNAIDQQRNNEEIQFLRDQEAYRRQQEQNQQQAPQTYYPQTTNNPTLDRQLGMTGQRTTYPGDDGVYRSAFSHGVNDHLNSRLRGGYQGPTPHINVFGQASTSGINRGLGRSAVISGAHGGGVGGAMSSRTTSRNVPPIGGPFSQHFTQ